MLILAVIKRDNLKRVYLDFTALKVRQKLCFQGFWIVFIVNSL